ncbi:hypothetical protein HA039_01110 [Streptomyces liangshanensis]|uniref:ABC transporter-associated repeat protein n=1 Tax=Streptomyces liangshanensis TaxID=2717324 RepID=A0A6G9H952_9ACTN|nr:hypothetical protein HA039_01110 [Streptomyces liangshanensis]
MRRPTSRRSVAAVPVVAASVLALLLGPAAPGTAADRVGVAAPGDRTVVGDGHVDLGPRFDRGRWAVEIRDDTADPATWRAPDDVVLQVGDAARITVPDDRAFAFLGEPGARVWLLPQVQREGVLWPGWNSQDPEVAATVDREVTWQLTGVRGPGDFVLFLNGSFGTPTVLFDGRKPLPQETGIELNSHVHGNWAFTRPGTYLLDVRMTAEDKDGTHYEDSSTLRFSVGPQDPRRAFAPPPSAGPADGSAALLRWGAGGALAVVAAVVTPLVRRRLRDRSRRQEGTRT